MPAARSGGRLLGLRKDNGDALVSILLGILAVWRITNLLNAEDGPFELVVRLRRMAGEGFWGQLLDCFYCLSVWIAAPFALCLGKTPGERILMWPVLSAGAIWIGSMMTEGVANRRLYM